MAHLSYSPAFESHVERALSTRIERAKDEFFDKTVEAFKERLREEMASFVVVLEKSLDEARGGYNYAIILKENVK